MTTEHSTENRRVHPKKFALWIGIGSIVMMFAGLTSAFIVNKSSSQGNWINFNLPWTFYLSTVVILCSSLSIHYAVKTFKKRAIPVHRRLVTLTLILGVVFTVLQILGFYELFAVMKWQNNVSFHFLVAIVSVHALHLVGGIVALLILYLRTFSKRVKTFSPTGIEMVATYWHFVDILWIYLFIFFLVGI